MSFNLTRNTRTEAVPCVPCCVGDLEKCCTDELSSSETNSINIYFYNFKLNPAPANNQGYTMIGNPYLDFSISPFSATLPRIDLVSSTAPAGFNFNSYGSNMTDLASAGLDPTVNPTDGSYPLYNVTARKIPLTVNIEAKNTPEVLIGSYREKYEVVKVNNTDYFADVFVQCQNSKYTVSLLWWRVPGTNDTPYGRFFYNRPDIAGMTRMIQMANTLSTTDISNVSKCDPLLVSGTNSSVCFPCGIYNPAEGQTFTNLAYWRQRYSYNNGATWQTGIYLYSYAPFNFTMDWIITE